MKKMIIAIAAMLFAVCDAQAQLNVVKSGGSSKKRVHVAGGMELALPCK